MNHNFRRLLISAVLMITILFGTAAAFADCVCLDATGNQYPSDTNTSAACYVCTDGECTLNGFTYGQCNVVNEEQPVQQPVTAPQTQPAVTDTPAAGTVTGGNDDAAQNGQNNTGSEGGQNTGGAVDTGTTGTNTDTNPNTDTNEDTEKNGGSGSSDLIGLTLPGGDDTKTQDETDTAENGVTDPVTDPGTGDNAGDNTGDGTGDNAGDGAGDDTCAEGDENCTKDDETTCEGENCPEVETTCEGENCPEDDDAASANSIDITEGKLTSLALSTPAAGAYVTSTPVTFTWVYTTDGSGTAVAVDFKLTLQAVDSGTDDVIDTTVTVNSASCSNAICTYTGDPGITNGSVTWSVSGTYNNGTEDVTISSGSNTFTMNVSDEPTPAPVEKPAAPVLESPSGHYNVRSIGFSWKPVEGAITYTVNWSNDKGKNGNKSITASDATCQAGSCTTYITLPGVGSYTWTVTASNTAGETKSKSKSFEIATNVTTPNPYSPNTSYYNRNYPAFQWEDVEDGVTDYRIQVVGKYNNHIYLDRWFSTRDLYIGDGVCYVQTDLFLPAGTYSWRVMGRNSEFNSGWSSWLDFTVYCDYCKPTGAYYGTYTNTTPTPTYPTATITVLNPNYQWRTLTGAAYYIIDVYDSAGKTVLEQNVNSTNCTAELCTWTPTTSLPGNGTYTWSVKGYGANNGLWGSATGSFTVQADIKMNKITFRTPVEGGYLSQDTPLVIWSDPGDTCVMFEVSIYDNTDALLLTAQLNREQAWCDGLTCSIQFATIPDGENYKINVTPYSELNTAGETASLTFNKGVQPLKLTSPKEGAVAQSRPMFRWTLDAGEGATYELLITDANGVSTLISPLVCGENGVTCEEGEAFYIPTDALIAGTYTAKLGIQGASSIGEPVNFTVK